MTERRVASEVPIDRAAMGAGPPELEARRALVGAPPRPRAHPLLGWAPDLRRSQVEAYVRVMREHGDVVCLSVGPSWLGLAPYCVFHPDGVRQVLAGSREAYTKRNRFYVQIAEAFGWGLLTAEGERWQHQRRLIQPLFTRRQIAGYAELMAEEAAVVVEAWQRAAKDGAAVDANAEMVRLTLRVVGARSSATTSSRRFRCSTQRSRCSTTVHSSGGPPPSLRPCPGRRRPTGGRGGRGKRSMASLIS